MNIKLVKSKAKKQATKIQNMLKSSLKGKDLGEKGWMNLNDAAELIRYYNCVATGKFLKAWIIQSEQMDTEVYGKIDNKVYNFIYDCNEFEDRNDFECK